MNQRKGQYADMVNKYYDLATSFYEYGEQLANRTTAAAQTAPGAGSQHCVSCLPPGSHTAVTAAQAGAPPSTLRTG